NHPEYSIEDEPLRFSSFLDKNKTKLSHFYSGKGLPELETDSSFLVHAQFLEYIQFRNQKLFQISEKIYFGSIV
ncbi:MAG: hypothetical protein WD512_12900, partial [Candidatus Paceibacterota bacterium]